MESELDFEFFDCGHRGKVKGTIVVNKENPTAGRTASEVDKNMRKEGWGGLFENDQQRDHCKFLEKQIKEGYMGGSKIHLKPQAVDRLMEQYKK